ncbi:MAG: hypothetical protein LBR80_18100 [Deltaproteobacteria bacterium]|jgi:hypothetical protein|nr:hypothetical protein [Deltaproteobacteria bacterium]
MDAVFGRENFRNEIIWKRTSAHSDAMRWGAVHDTILNYVRSGDFVWNRHRNGHYGKYVAQKYRCADGDGRRYRLSDATALGLASYRRYLDEIPGVPVADFRVLVPPSMIVRSRAMPPVSIYPITGRPCQGFSPF